MITWHNAKTNLPTQYQSVLMAIEPGKEADEGFLSVGDQWRFTDGTLVLNIVYAWTELPICPVIMPEPDADCAIAGRDSAHSFTEGSQVEGRAA